MNAPRTGLLASLAIAVASCGSPTPAPAPSPTAAAASGDAAKVAGLSPQLRAGVLLRAIRDAGQDCQQVIDQATVPSVGGPLTWIATCQDRRRWLVGIAPDGTASVRSASAGRS